MDFAVVVLHEVHRDGVGVVFDFLAVGVCEAVESAHAHPPGKVLTLEVGRANVLLIGRTADCSPLASDARWRTVSGCAGSSRAVDFDELCEANVTAESVVDRVEIRFESVGFELHAVRDPARNVGHELRGISAIAESDHVTDDELWIVLQSRSTSKRHQIQTGRAYLPVRSPASCRRTTRFHRTRRAWP